MFNNRYKKIGANWSWNGAKTRRNGAKRASAPIFAGRKDPLRVAGIKAENWNFEFQVLRVGTKFASRKIAPRDAFCSVLIEEGAKIIAISA